MFLVWPKNCIGDCGCVGRPQLTSLITYGSFVKFQKVTALGIAGLIFLNAGSVFAADAASGLLDGIKNLQASIDSGKTKPADAVNTFAASIVKNNVSIDEVNAFVKTQMSAKAFVKYQSDLNSSLRGIDPASLTSQEMGEIVGQSLADIHTEGLYWSGCANVWTGAALITAAIVAGAIGMVKSKSISAIQADYNAKIASTQNQYSSDITNTKNAYNQEISDAQNWKTTYPQKVSSAKNDINSQNSTISNANSDITIKQNDLNNVQGSYSDAQYYYNSAQSNYNTAQNNYNYAVANNDTANASYYQSQMNQYQSQVNQYQSQVDQYANIINSDRNAISSDQSSIQSAESSISSDQNNISFYNSKYQEYSANPNDVQVDTTAYGNQRDTSVANLNSQETTAVANLNSQESSAVAQAPSNQKFGQELFVGAGIGAAIGAGLLIYGFKEGACGSY